MSFLESAALVQIGKNSREAELITARGDAEIAEMRLDAAEARYDNVLIRGKAQIHNLRARYKAHEAVEKEMVEVIVKYEPDNPLTDPVEVEKKVDALQVQYASDPEVIKMTYPDGRVEGDPYPLKVIEDPDHPGVMISVTRNALA